MDKIFEILRENPEVGVLFIASTFGSIGFIFKTIIDTFLESKKFRQEIKRVFWTEKLTAAKKASEYYYEHLELIELMIHNIEITLNSEFSGPLQESIQETLKILSDRSINPKSFEHHHIHMFYDIDTVKFDKLNEESFKIIQELEKIEILDSDSSETIDQKLSSAKAILVDLKNNHRKKKEIYKKNLAKIKSDLGSFAK